MYVVNSFGAGGAERHLLALASYMTRAGHSVLVVALTGAVPGGAKNIAEDFVSAGVQIAMLDRAGVGWLRDAGRWFGLCKLARAWAPDILHSHLPRADFAASFVKRMLPDIIWISTAHDAYIKGVYSGYWVFRWLGWNWRLADHIVAVSGHAQRWVLEVLRLSEARTSIIYHGIARLPADLEARTAISNAHPFVVGCLARFEPRKGIATLIKAMVTVCAKHPGARLVIAGSDPTGYANAMRRLADTLRVGHAVDIQDFCDDPLDFLCRLDMFAFASISEGFGIVLLEAMAIGLPVVASDIYPVNHIVVGGETGLLANPAEPEAFAAALIDLLENPELAHRLGEAGRRRCQQEFSEEKMMQSTESLYFGQTGCSPDVAPQRSR
jgi:glycosyltransferase involved in cell wall biosynthesis